VQLATEVSDLHIVTKIGRQVVGTMIMSASNGKAKMRQVAVLSEFQSVGVGMNMVNFFEQLSKSLELNAVVLHARETAVSFYKKLGYTKEGNVFEEVGIPHWKMTKPL
jgi:predicted GNAT family N-acyltransferase